MSKFKHAGAIAGRSTRPGAFYFPAPRDKGRKAYYEPRKDWKYAFWPKNGCLAYIRQSKSWKCRWRYCLVYLDRPRVLRLYTGLLRSVKISYQYACAEDIGRRINRWDYSNLEKIFKNRIRQPFPALCRDCLHVLFCAPAAFALVRLRAARFPSNVLICVLRRFPC